MADELVAERDHQGVEHDRDVQHETADAHFERVERRVVIVVGARGHGVHEVEHVLVPPGRVVGARARERSVHEHGEHEPLGADDEAERAQHVGGPYRLGAVLAEQAHVLAAPSAGQELFARPVQQPPQVVGPAHEREALEQVQRVDQVEEQLHEHVIAGDHTVPLEALADQRQQHDESYDDVDDDPGQPVHVPVEKFRPVRVEYVVKTEQLEQRQVYARFVRPRRVYIITIVIF